MSKKITKNIINNIIKNKKEQAIKIKLGEVEVIIDKNLSLETEYAMIKDIANMMIVNIGTDKDDYIVNKDFAMCYGVFKYMSNLDFKGDVDKMREFDNATGIMKVVRAELNDTYIKIENNAYETAMIRLKNKIGLSPTLNLINELINNLNNAVVKNADSKYSIDEIVDTVNSIKEINVDTLTETVINKYRESDKNGESL